ncbi:hypothetical protein N9L92_01140, partial [Saprospiraceae bacterium]|nr:hypothetical protein [Saprospiraceae bacterium]
MVILLLSIESRKIRHLFTILFIVTAACCISQDCFYSSPTVIQSEDSLSLSLEVTGLTNNDLSAGQGICGVRLFFNHGQVENIRITLTSPSGQVVTIVGPGTINSGLTGFINWNVLFVPCSFPAAPDLGFSDTWNNDQPWSAFTTYDGSYYTFNGCLEDFDTGPANGVWTLDIENLGGIDGNIEFFELIFCDPAGVDCDPCFLDAGDLQEEFFTTCQQDVRLRDLDAFLSPDFIINNTDQAYSFLLLQGDDIIAIEDEILQSDTLLAGVYTICGLAYQQRDTSLIQQQNQLPELIGLIDSEQICADLTDPCFTLIISAVDNILSLDTTLCRGDTLDFFGIKVFDNLDTNILRTNQITCDSLISINAQLVEPLADINAPLLVTTCGDPIFLDARGSTTNGSDINYNWSTVDGNFTIDIGPIAQVDTAGYYLLEVESNGCTDTVGVAISSVDTFSLDFTIDAPVCIEDTFVISLETDVDVFSLDGPSTIDVNNDGFTTIEDGIFIVESQVGQCVRMDTLILMNEATLINVDVSSTIIDCDSVFSKTTVVTNAINPSFSYSGPEIILENSANIEITTPGFYSVTVTDEKGCTATKDFEVEGSADVPSFTTEDVLIACNDPLPLLPLEIMTPFDSIVWSGPNDFLSNELNPIALDTGIYTVTVFAPSGCTLSNSIIYSEFNVSPDINIIGDTLTCVQDTALLCLVGEFSSIEWSFDNAVISNDSCIVVDQAGLYMANVLDINGCTGSGSFDLIGIDFLDIVINDLPVSSTITCIDSNVVLAPIVQADTSDLVFAWFLSDTLISNDSQITVNTPGLYVLEVTDSNTGCNLLDTTLVTQIVSSLDSNNIFITFDTIACNLDSAEVLINGIDLEDIDLYINQELISDPLSIMLAEGEYDFNFVDSLGCEITIPQSITALDTFSLELGPDIMAGVGQSVDIQIDISIPLSEITSFEWSDPDILDCTSCIDPSLTIVGDQTLSLTV